MNIRWHLKALQQGICGIQPIGTRQFRNPTIAEVLHFETCHAAAPYSPVNVQTPKGVPSWQYVDPADRAHAARRFGNTTTVASLS